LLYDVTAPGYALLSLFTSRANLNTLLFDPNLRVVSRAKFAVFMAGFVPRLKSLSHTFCHEFAAGTFFFL